MKTTMDDFLKYSKNEGASENVDAAWENISDEKINDAFKKFGLSSDVKDNWANDIRYGSDETLVVNYTSMAFGGESPKNISSVMEDISKEIGAVDWWFLEGENKVLFDFRK